MILNKIPLKNKINSSPIYEESVIRATKKKLPLPIINSLETFEKACSFSPVEIIGTVSNIHVKKDGSIEADITIKNELKEIKPTLSLVGVKLELDDEVTFKIEGFKLNIEGEE